MHFKPRRISELAFACVALAFAGWALFASSRRLHQNRDQWRQAIADLRAADQARSAAERSAQQAADSLAHAKAELRKARQAIAVQLPVTGHPDDGRQLARWTDMRRVALQRDYGAFFRERRIPTAKRKALLDILLQNEIDSWDLNTALQAQKIPRSDPAFNDAWAALAKGTSETEQQLLDPADFDALGSYTRSLAARSLVSQWAGGAAVLAGEPLSSDQGNRLIQAIEDASESYRSGGYLDLATVNWDSVFQSAQGYLTRAQLNLITQGEPQLPNGGRFQSLLWSTVHAAGAKDSPPVR